MKIKSPKLARLRITMKAISFLLIFGVLLTFTPPTYAQSDVGCDDVLLNDPLAHQFSLFLLDGLDTFDQIEYENAFIAYSQHLTITEEQCGLGTQAKLLSWAIEVYRLHDAKGKILDEEKYTAVYNLLLDQKGKVLALYCSAYPAACRGGEVLQYDKFLSTNGLTSPPIEVLEPIEGDCTDYLTNEMHQVETYILTELERPSFSRQDYLIGMIVYANQMSNVCGYTHSRAFMHYAFAVYNVEGNYALGLINADQYAQQSRALLLFTPYLIKQYCNTYAIACKDGQPIKLYQQNNVDS